MVDGPKIVPQLTGVPETLLWTLYYRAQEAARPDSVLDDPLAVELVDRIDYPFAARLGQGAGRAQWQGLRAVTFDARILDFVAAHPRGTVVALGEGLETQFWRTDDGQVDWLGGGPPESGGPARPGAAARRRQVLPAHPRHRMVDVSALDESWADRVDPRRGVLITAQGLLMYLT